MNGLQLISTYEQNDPMRGSFNRLARETFGIDFEEWYRNGFWNSRYCCYSYWNGERVVANVSASRMTLCIEGQHHDAIQIGTVMTTPEYRNQGLASALLQHVVEQYESRTATMFLFSRPSAVSLYEKHGFMRLPTREVLYQLELSDHGSDTGTVRRLRLDDAGDIRLLGELINGAAIHHGPFFVEDSEGIVMWYAFNVFRNDVYVINDRAAVFAKQEGSMLHVYGVMSPYPYQLCDVLKKVNQGGSRTAVLWFTPPEEPGADIRHAAYDPVDVLLVRGQEGWTSKPFKYPILAQA